MLLLLVLQQGLGCEFVDVALGYAGVGQLGQEVLIGVDESVVKEGGA